MAQIVKPDSGLHFQIKSLLTPFDWFTIRSKEWNSFWIRPPLMLSACGLRNLDWGFSFRVSASGLGVQGSGLRLWGLRLRIQGLKFGVSGSGSKVSGFRA